ncbi:MAG: hypothetical protein E7055_01740 [Lentisphaerae bacterium]|nr:hypothetical protein [Lentisphaerota bacterium]
MTDAELIAAVNEYLAAHMDAAFWSARSNEEKAAAVTMAKNQVLAELNLSAVPLLVPSVTMAIAEQAVFLAHNYESMKEGKVVTGESVGDLSVSYSLLSGSGFGSFAKVFIDAARRACSPTLVRVGRG